MARRTLIPSIGAACLLAGHAARASEPESWPLGEAIEVHEGECIQRDAILPSVETWLGRNSIDRRVRIVLDENEPGRPRFVVLRDGKPAAERRFKQSSIACPDLRAAVALAIALAIDATILQALLEPEPEPEPAPEPPPESVAPPVTSVRPPERDQPPARPPETLPEPPADPLSGEAAAGVWIGVLPVVGFGGALAVSLPLGPIALRAGGFAVTGARAAVGAGEADASLVAAELGVCLASALAPLTLRGCAGGAGGAFSATGSGYSVNRATALPWIAVAAGLGAELPVARAVSLVARVTGYVAIARPSHEVNAPDGAVVDRETLPAAGLGTTLGLRVDFP